MTVSALDLLADDIRAAWSRETSADPDFWTPENPAWGQCAVTALVIQDAFGGDLRRGVVHGMSHYWNRLPDGRMVDLTFKQFRVNTDRPEGEDRDRAYVLSFPATVARYERLCAAIGRRPNLPSPASGEMEL